MRKVRAQARTTPRTRAKIKKVEPLTKPSAAILAKHVIADRTTSTARSSNNARRVVLAALNAVVRLIAPLGGFLGRKGDGEPEAKTLWLGYVTLPCALRGFALLISCSSSQSR